MQFKSLMAFCICHYKGFDDDRVISIMVFADSICIFGPVHSLPVAKSIQDPKNLPLL